MNIMELNKFRIILKYSSGKENSFRKAYKRQVSKRVQKQIERDNNVFCNVDNICLKIPYIYNFESIDNFLLVEYNNIINLATNKIAFFKQRFNLGVKYKRNSCYAITGISLKVIAYLSYAY